MSVPIPMRCDFDAALREAAKATKNAGQARRLLVLTMIYNGGSRSNAAHLCGVGLQ